MTTGSSVNLISSFFSTQVIEQPNSSANENLKRIEFDLIQNEWNLIDNTIACSKWFGTALETSFNKPLLEFLNGNKSDLL